MRNLKKGLTIILVLIFAFAIIILSRCGSYFDNGNIQRVGMLVEDSIHDQAWGTKGYLGLLEIKNEFDVDVYFKEGVQTELQVYRAIEEFSNKGVNLIFGHSSVYGKFFKEIQQEYPDIHFVYFNGGYTGERLTSLNFSSNAMGFFGGMVAGKMTTTNQVGVIAAYEWQPEIEGFFEGVNYQNPEATVHMEFVNAWDDVDQAMQYFEKLRAQNVDVFYPAGDSFSVPIIEKVKESNLYSIGFVTEQSDIGESSVLTSTIQYVDQLYLLAAKKFNQGKLNGGVQTYDFQDGVIALGEFSQEVPEYFKESIEQSVEEYKESNLLPNETNFTN
ncbi:BMP family ABC transporter substrate-binding protein [Radiobacillus sp. PE A8.2]|uniref:BMP family ABC transporter substrate-binding protein n=1 Tax=Radiobacillus sp. PE A8.2 TaxID=3380349 RepID=UPI00388F0BE0